MFIANSVNFHPFLCWTNSTPFCDALVITPHVSATVGVHSTEDKARYHLRTFLIQDRFFLIVAWCHLWRKTDEWIRQDGCSDCFTSCTVLLCEMHHRHCPHHDEYHTCREANHTHVKASKRRLGWSIYPRTTKTRHTGIKRKSVHSPIVRPHEESARWAILRYKDDLRRWVKTSSVLRPQI